jgi:hypothetical protein
VVDVRVALRPERRRQVLELAIAWQLVGEVACGMDCSEVLRWPRNAYWLRPYGAVDPRLRHILIWDRSCSELGQRGSAGVFESVAMAGVVICGFIVTLRCDYRQRWRFERLGHSGLVFGLACSC